MPYKLSSPFFTFCSQTGKKPYFPFLYYKLNPNGTTSPRTEKELYYILCAVSMLRNSCVHSDDETQTYLFTEKSIRTQESIAKVKDIVFKKEGFVDRGRYIRNVESKSKFMAVADSLYAERVRHATLKLENDLTKIAAGIVCAVLPDADKDELLAQFVRTTILKETDTNFSVRTLRGAIMSIMSGSQGKVKPSHDIHAKKLCNGSQEALKLIYTVLDQTIIYLLNSDKELRDLRLGDGIMTGREQGADANADISSKEKAKAYANCADDLFKDYEGIFSKAVCATLLACGVDARAIFQKGMDKEYQETNKVVVQARELAKGLSWAGMVEKTGVYDVHYFTKIVNILTMFLDKYAVSQVVNRLAGKFADIAYFNQVIVSEGLNYGATEENPVGYNSYYSVEIDENSVDGERRERKKRRDKEKPNYKGWLTAPCANGALMGENLQDVRNNRKNTYSYKELGTLLGYRNDDFVNQDIIGKYLDYSEEPTEAIKNKLKQLFDNLAERHVSFIDYTPFNEAEQIAKELRRLSVLCGGGDNFDRDKMSKKANLWRDAISLCDLNGELSQEEIMSLAEDFASGKQSFKLKMYGAVKRFAEQAINSDAFLYLMRYSTPEKLRQILKNKEVVIVALKDMDKKLFKDKAYKEIVGDDQPTNISYNKKVENVANIVCSINEYTIGQSKAGGRRAIKSRLVSTVLNVLTIVLRNLIFTNSRYTIAFHCLSRDKRAKVYDAYTGDAPNEYFPQNGIAKASYYMGVDALVVMRSNRYHGETSTLSGNNYLNLLTKYYLSLKDNGANWPYNKKSFTAISDTISKYSTKPQMDGLSYSIKTYRDIISHLSVLRNIDKYIADINVGSLSFSHSNFALQNWHNAWFAMFHYIAQIETLEYMTQKEEKQQLDNADTRKRPLLSSLPVSKSLQKAKADRRCNSDAVRTLNIAFAYNLSRFRNLTYDRLIDKRQGKAFKKYRGQRKGTPSK